MATKPLETSQQQGCLCRFCVQQGCLVLHAWQTTNHWPSSSHRKARRESHVYRLDRGWRSIRPWGAEILEPDDIPCHPPLWRSMRKCWRRQTLRLRSQRTVGRFSPAMDSYVHMLKRQALYDAKKLLGWDEAAYEKLISDFEFMAKLAQEGKIIQGMFVGRKKDVQREMWVVVVHRFAPSQARHFPAKFLARSCKGRFWLSIL